jgi:hypothetical protein
VPPLWPFKPDSSSISLTKALRAMQGCLQNGKTGETEDGEEQSMAGNIVYKVWEDDCSGFAHVNI